MILWRAGAKKNKTITTTLSAEQVEIVCSPDTLFTEYSFAIEQGIDWFFGRGVSALKTQRSKARQEQRVTVTPLVPAKPMTYSLVTSIGTMVKAGFWPKEIPFEELWRVPGERQEVRNGHHRVVRANKEMTIIQTYGLAPDLSIGMLAYGLSDLITGVFWQGATCVKFQGSIGVLQQHIDKGFEGDDLVRYLADQGDGYAIHQKVSTLP